jgi:hypothetical protein
MLFPAAGVAQLSKLCSVGCMTPFTVAHRIVPQQTAFVVERLGKYHKTLGSGLHFLIPMVSRTQQLAFYAAVHAAVGQTQQLSSSQSLLYLQFLSSTLLACTLPVRCCYRWLTRVSQPAGLASAQQKHPPGPHPPMLTSLHTAARTASPTAASTA